MTDIRDFIAARLDAAAAAFQEEAGSTEHECFRNETRQYWASGDRVRVVSHCGCSTPENPGARRALRDIEAKRAILELGICLACDVEGQLCNHRDETLRHIAAVWSDYEDYQPEWSTA